MEEKEIKNCKILGFKEITRKEDMERVLIVNVSVKTYDKDYIGDFPLPVIYLDYSLELKEKMELYLLHPEKFACAYEVRSNIITGKAKISNILIEEI